MPRSECVKKLSISPTLYKQLFHTKEFCKSFLYLQFDFVIFWQKNIGAKASSKVLVKFAQGKKSSQSDSKKVGPIPQNLSDVCCRSDVW
jgi:hypothetical protein